MSTGPIKLSQVERIHALTRQRAALKRLTRVARPIGSIEVIVHGEVGAITGPFGNDGLSLKLDQEIHAAKVSLETRLTATFKGAVLGRLSAVDSELETLGIDVDE